MDLFKLLGTIAVNNADANKALDETSQKGEKAKGKLSKAFSTIGKGAAVVGKTVATGLAAGGAAMGALTVKALNMSGELEQNMGGSEAVFGKYAGKMQSTAKTAFSNMGLSTSDYLATANKMGALFQGAGFSIKDSMDLSSGAMQRAADVASIMGIDTSAAMEAIAGAAKGNFTMMDNLGVAMNDTTLNAYALEKGINKTTQEMTNQEKIGLAMEMFMDKTAYAAGNYAKENETLAGSLGTAKAALTNFLDGSGSVEDLVNSFSSAANVIVKNLKTLAPRLISGITDIINQIIPMLPPLLQQILPVLIEGAVSLINGLVAAMPMIISAIMAALPALIQGIQQIINALIQALPQIIQALVAALPTLIPMLVDALVSMIVMLCTMLPQIIQPIIDYLPEIIIAIVNALLTNLPVLIEGFVALIGGIIQALPQILGALWEAISTLISTWGGRVVEWLTPIWNGITQWFSDLWNSISEWFSNAITSVAQWFSDIWEGAKTVCSSFASWINTNIVQPVIGFFQSLWNGIKTIWDGICNAISFAIQLIGSIISAAVQIITVPFRFIWENCKQYVFAAWEWIKAKVNAAINKVKSVISTVMNAIKNVFTTVWNAVKTVFTTVWNAIVNFISPIVSKIKTIITTAWSAIKTVITTVLRAIKSVVTTVWSSIKNAVTTVVNAIKSVVTRVWNSIKTAVSTAINAIKSTVSSVFNSIKSTVSSIFNGIKTTAITVWNGIKTSISTAVNSVKSTVTTVFNNIKTAITKPIDDAKNTVSGIVDKIKGFFNNMKLSLPKIKLPHFSISGEFSISPPSVPHLSIEWYKKAYNNPMIMNEPSIFGYNPATGSFMGGGDGNGSEVVSGVNTLMNMIKTAVASENGAIVYYLQKLVEILADYFPQILEALDFDFGFDADLFVKRHAPKIDKELGKIQNRKARGRA